MAVAQALMETCVLSYKNSETGLGADEIAFLATEHRRGKEFEMPMPSGFYLIDPEYVLRPGNGLISFRSTLWIINFRLRCSSMFAGLTNVISPSWP